MRTLSGLVSQVRAQLQELGTLSEAAVQGVQQAQQFAQMFNVFSWNPGLLFCCFAHLLFNSRGSSQISPDYPWNVRGILSKFFGIFVEICRQLMFSSSFMEVLCK